MSDTSEANTTVHNLGSVEMIPVGEGRTFQIGELSIAVFRTRDGRVFATQALCPHREGLLADAILGGDKLVCPLHSFKFDIMSGQPIGNSCEALKTYSVELSAAGDILLEVDEEIFQLCFESLMVS